MGLFGPPSEGTLRAREERRERRQHRRDEFRRKMDLAEQERQERIAQSGKSREQMVEQFRDRTAEARQQAVSANFPQAENAELVVAGFGVKPPSYAWMLIDDERIGVVNEGLFDFKRTGRRDDSIAYSKISSIELTAQGLIWGVITVRAPGAAMTFKIDRPHAEALHGELQRRLHEHQTGSAVEAEARDVDVVEQIRQLGELHTAGVLTEDEFIAKKADLLGRI